MKKAFIICCLIAIFPVFHVSAQKVNKKILITGVVVDNDDKPMSNAMLLVDGMKTSVVTNTEGHYRIKVQPYARTLGVIAFGSGVIEEEIANRTEINFYFKSKKSEPQQETSDASSENDMVDTGYSDVNTATLTTPVGRVKPDRSKRTYTSIFEMLQTVPGVKVVGSTVIVQNSQDFMGPVEPLYVVDGVPVNSIADISPATVESIEVLKGSSASIYGSRGYGGVILIKRKSLN